MKKTKLKGVCWGQTLSTAMGVIVLSITTGAGLDAATLWNNGTPANGPAGNDNTTISSMWLFDNFTVPVGATGWGISSFDITDFFLNTNGSNSPAGTPSADYKSTSWSIWKGAGPLDGGTLVTTGSGGSITSCVGNLCKITVNVSVWLGAGTYYLGTSNVLNTATSSGGNGDYTSRSYTDAALTTFNGTSTVTPATPPGYAWEQAGVSIVGANGNVAGTCITGRCVNGPGSETAFDITGAVVAPEPGSLVLMSLALAGLGYTLRRRAA